MKKIDFVPGGKIVFAFMAFLAMLSLILGVATIPDIRCLYAFAFLTIFILGIIFCFKNKYIDCIKIGDGKIQYKKTTIEIKNCFLTLDLMYYPIARDPKYGIYIADHYIQKDENKKQIFRVVLQNSKKLEIVLNNYNKKIEIFDSEKICNLKIDKIIKTHNAKFE